MKFLLKPYISLFVLLIVACGEDRTYQYVEKTARDHWIQETMQANYLWGDSIKDLDWKVYFNDPKTFFSKMIAQAPVKDSWSWCSIDTLNEDYHVRGNFNHVNSYGMDFTVMTDPTTATSRQYARVISVYNGSPAYRCGIRRGDFIAMIDGSRFTSSASSSLVSGKSHTLVVNKLGIDYSEVEEGQFVWASEDTLQLPASEYVEDVAFPIAHVVETDRGSVGYLMCNRLTAGPIETDPQSNAYLNGLNEAMASFDGKDFEAFVLDLRLCNFGTMEMACRLASYLVEETNEGRVFAKTFHRTDRTDANTSYLFDSDALARNLAVSHLYIITSSYTKGAAEWLIRGIRQAMGTDYVTLVGQTSAGQIVMTGNIPSDYFVTLHPAVAYVADADDSYDYSAGLTPDIAINELQYVTLYAYGDIRELIFQTILEELK